MQKYNFFERTCIAGGILSSNKNEGCRGIPRFSLQKPHSLPRGEGGPKGRVRNSGRNPKVSTTQQTSTRVALKTTPW